MKVTSRLFGRWRRNGRGWQLNRGNKEGEIQNEFPSMSTGRVARHCLLISLPMVRSIHIHPVRTGHHCTTIRNSSTITMNCLLLSPRVATTMTQLAEPFDTHRMDDNRPVYRRLHFLTDTLLTLFPSLGHVFPSSPFSYSFRYVRGAYSFFPKRCNGTANKRKTFRPQQFVTNSSGKCFSLTFISRPLGNLPLRHFNSRTRYSCVAVKNFSPFFLSKNT